MNLAWMQTSRSRRARDAMPPFNQDAHRERAHRPSSSELLQPATASDSVTITEQHGACRRPTLPTQTQTHAHIHCIHCHIHRDAHSLAQTRRQDSTQIDSDTRTNGQTNTGVHECGVAALCFCGCLCRMAEWCPAIVVWQVVWCVMCMVCVRV